jgi:predicted Fe-S protein YdhL (DUF1289 family)
MAFIQSPCVGICELDADGLCRGCFRSRDELRRWRTMSEAEKAAINDRVLPRIWARTGLSSG